MLPDLVTKLTKSGHSRDAENVVETLKDFVDNCLKMPEKRKKAKKKENNKVIRFCTNSSRK